MLYDFKEYSPQKHEDKPYYANPRKYHPKHKASPLKSLYHKREDNEMEISKPITVNGQEVTKLELDFDKITGRDLVQSEVETRAKGDSSPAIFLSMKFQMIVAAKAMGVKSEDLLGLSASDCKKIIAPTALFLVSYAS